MDAGVGTGSDAGGGTGSDAGGGTGSDAGGGTGSDAGGGTGSDAGSCPEAGSCGGSDAGTGGGSDAGSGGGSDAGSGDGSDEPPDDPDEGSGSGSGSGSGDPGDGVPPYEDCFGDLLSVAEAREAELRAQILPACPTYSATPPVTSPTPITITEAPDSEEEGAMEGSAARPASPSGNEPLSPSQPTNCGYSDAQIASHRSAMDALAEFQSWFRNYLETPAIIYASGRLFSTSSLLSCLNALQNPLLAGPPVGPPAPVCNPPNQEYNCKGVVNGRTDSYWNGNSNDWFKSDATRGTTCTDTLWLDPFFWERLLYPPWARANPQQLARKAQVLVRASSGNAWGRIWSWETRTSCHRETESVKTKFRLVLEPRATIVPRWVWDPRGAGQWVPNNQNWAFFWDANNARCSSDCLQAGEGERQFKIGASVRPKLSALFGGLTQSDLIPDGYWDWGNSTTNFLSQVLGTLHCFGPGTLYTAQDTFTTVPSDVPMPFDAQIAPDCTVTDNLSVNGSVSYTQQGQQPSFTLGIGGQAGRQTSCKRNAGSEIRLALSCNMAEGAGFANFRSGTIDMPAHSDNCKTAGTCAWQSMTTGGGQQAANKLDLGYWFEQLAAIARASPADGNNWAHRRGAYSHFRRGGWQYDVTSPDWPGSWANHRHAWEGNACKVYKITNPVQGTTEAMPDDKAICVFAGQTVTDPHANPGAPAATNPNVMLWPYDNGAAQWDPELGRPATAICTQNAQCLSGTCQGGRCQ